MCLFPSRIPRSRCMVAEPLKSELIDRTAEWVRSRVDPAVAGAAEDFTRQFYADVPPDDIAGDTPENLGGAALSLWDLVQQRLPGTPKIRIYNPRPEEHGWGFRGTVIEIVNDDMSFLVDSVASELTRLGAELRLVIHPVVAVERDAAGTLTCLLPPGPRDGGLRESLMHVRLGSQPAARHAEIQQRLETVLAD